MHFFYYNDNIVSESELKISPFNRAFRYGDGLFETLLVVNKNPVFIRYNLQRLLKGMDLLSFEIPKVWSDTYFSSAIQLLCDKNKLRNARCKISVWRSGDGLYSPEKNAPALLIELTKHPANTFALNTEGLTVGINENYLRLMHPLSSCKTANALHYVLAAKFAQAQKLDNVILMNTEKKLADAVGANIFLVMNNAVFTTLEMNGGVEGTMQKIICEHAAAWKIKLERIEMAKKELLMADEFFLTNAIHGVQWVKQFEEKTYQNTFSQKLITLLNSLLPAK